jgi:hypothetical protein
VSDDGIVIVNFGHPLTEAQRAQIESLTGQSVARVLDVASCIEIERELMPQVVTLVDLVPLSTEEWRRSQLLISPPGPSSLASVLLAELHGRCGRFPRCLRMSSIPDRVPPLYEVAEVIDLQCLRDTARMKRG